MASGTVVLCILLAIAALLWFVGEFLAKTSRIALVARWIWIALVTVMLCGLRISVD